METITEILRKLGITKCYKGLNHTAYAISLAVSDDSRLEAVTKEIYMETASHFGCSWTAIERNIRTVAFHAWHTNPELLCRMARYPLAGSPSASAFIEIIASHIIRSSQPQQKLRPFIFN